MKFIKFHKKYINASMIIALYLQHSGPNWLCYIEITGDCDRESFDTLEAAQTRLDELLAILNQPGPIHAPAQFYYNNDPRVDFELD
jgi:hypothetical protein